MQIAPRSAACDLGRRCGLRSLPPRPRTPAPPRPRDQGLREPGRRQGAGPRASGRAGAARTPAKAARTGRGPGKIAFLGELSRDPRSTIIGDGRGSSGIDSGSGFSSDRRRDAIRAAGVFAWARGALMIKLLRQPHGDRHDAAQAAAIVRARAADRIALAFCKPTGQRLRRKSACARAGSSRGWTARAKPAVRRWSAARRALIRILAGGVSPGQASRRSAPPNLGTVRGAADRRSAVDGGTKKPAAGIVDRAITPSARRGSSLGGGGADGESRFPPPRGWRAAHRSPLAARANGPKRFARSRRR